MKQILVLLAILALGLSANTAAWRGKTIYQVLTDRFWRTDNSTAPCKNLGDYCGGTFVGLMRKLDYIVGMGFDAIWISPMVDNTPGGYHGYWARNWYQVNSNFGTKQDLINLVNAAHAKGLWVMLDVVANHVGPVGFDYSQIVPFNNNSNYHAYCQIQDWTNQWQVENCRLADLPDLAQEDPTTRQLLLNWVKDVVQTYKFDGLRIDTVPEVPKDFWSQYNQNSGVFTLGEVFDSRMSYVAGYQGPVDGVLNYPLYYTLRNVFQQGQSMNQIQTYYQQSSSLYPDPTVWGNFIDNHDNPRFLYQNGDKIAFKAALAFTLSAVGIPIVYYGDEQAYGGGPDPNNREQLWTNFDTNSDIYQYIKTILTFRKKTQFYNNTQIQRWSDDTFYAFTRGNIFFAFTNSKSQQVRLITYHPYSNGVTLCNLFYPSDCVIVTAGTFPVYLNNGEVKILAPKGTFEGESNEEIIENMEVEVDIDEEIFI